MGTISGWSRVARASWAAIVCAAAAMSAPVLAAGASGGGAEGEVKFNTYCRTCHSWLKGDNRLGPSLYGVVGRKAGTAPGYHGYSASMRDSGIVWTPAMIDKWITNPYKILPDTNMRPFPGVSDPKTRKIIIAFLASHHDPAPRHQSGSQPPRAQSPGSAH